MKLRWPTIRTIRVKLRHMPDILLDASVSLNTGKPVVDFRIDGADEGTLTPAEARSVSKALVRAADCCDAKTAAAKAMHSSPALEEYAPSSKQTPALKGRRNRGLR